MSAINQIRSASKVNYCIKGGMQHQQRLS